MYISNPDIPLIWPIQREVNKPKSGAGWANHPKTVVATQTRQIHKYTIYSRHTAMSAV